MIKLYIGACVLPSVLKKMYMDKNDVFLSFLSQLKLLNTSHEFEHIWKVSFICDIFFQISMPKKKIFQCSIF